MENFYKGICEEQTKKIEELKKELAEINNTNLSLCAENDRIQEKWAEEKETFIGIIDDLEDQIKQLQVRAEIWDKAQVL